MRDEVAPEKLYLKMPNKWWDGYKNQPVVLLDDFDIRHREYMTYYLKTWSDPYIFTVEKKNMVTQNIRPKKLIITSNYHPMQIWTQNEDLQPILRKFKCIHFIKRNEGPHPQFDILPNCETREAWEPVDEQLIRSFSIFQRPGVSTAPGFIRPSEDLPTWNPTTDSLLRFLEEN